jgi:SAM-dependent methyltransferase
MGFIRTVARSALQFAAQRISYRVTMASTAQTGKLMPLGDARGEFVIDPQVVRDEVPPKDLWLGYADNAQDYLACGASDMAIMLTILARHTSETPRVVLDLGCAAGRMIRHFPASAHSELWGLDINAGLIAWCQRNLETINFATISTAPHLPFESGHFDLVYCGSVFTHISDMADAWLLEVRRVLKPGGIAYLTLHDKVSYDQLFTAYRDDPLFADFIRDTSAFEDRHHLRDRAADVFSFGADPNSQVFYDRDYITGKWSRWMEPLSYELQAHDHQSAIVLRKRSSCC